MIGIKSLEQVQYILQDDAAIDKAHADYSWEKYWQTGDRAHIPIKPGCEPTVFHLKRLSRRAYLRVMGRPDAERISEAVAFGLVKVEGLTLNGAPVELSTTKTDLGERLDEATLDRMFVAGMFADLALRVLSLTEIHPF